MFVVVVLLVAGVAVLVVVRRGLEDHGQVGQAVAGAALEAVVCAEEVESVGCGEVVEVGVAPGVGVMAFGAGCGETGAGVFVVVIVLMAGDALLVVLSREDRGEVGGAVARSALEAIMRSYEVDPARGDQVIEQGALPLEVVMAGFAFSREAGGHVVDAACILIVRFVARDTLRIEGGEGAADLVGMAADAIDLSVRAGQRKASLGMDGDAFYVLKQGRIMAVDAVFGERALVYVHMAGGAVVELGVGLIEFEVDVA